MNSYDDDNAYTDVREVDEEDDARGVMHIGCLARTISVILGFILFVVIAILVLRHVYKIGSEENKKYEEEPDDYSYSEYEDYSEYDEYSDYSEYDEYSDYYEEADAAEGLTEEC